MLWEKNYQVKDCHFKDARCHKCNSKDTWQKCAGQAPQHPHANVHNKVIMLRRLQLVTPIFLSSKFMISTQDHFAMDLCIKGTTLIIEVDTGAIVTLISEETYRRHFLNIC